MLPLRTAGYRLGFQRATVVNCIGAAPSGGKPSIVSRLRPGSVAMQLTVSPGAAAPKGRREHRHLPGPMVQHLYFKGFCHGDGGGQTGAQAGSNQNPEHGEAGVKGWAGRHFYTGLWDGLLRWINCMTRGRNGPRLAVRRLRRLWAKDGIGASDRRRITLTEPERRQASAGNGGGTQRALQGLFWSARKIRR